MPSFRGNKSPSQRAGDRPTLTDRQDHPADLVDEISARLPWHLKLDDFAELVGYSPRTVQRRLKDARTSFKTLVDQARFHKALYRVSETDDSLTVIAMDLRYGDASSFTRAFRRWTGMSPREFRKLARTRSPRLAESSSVSQREMQANAAG